MAKSSPPPLRYAFTLIELLVVIATIGILAAILLPVANSTLERAKVTKDLSNLRQIGAATQMYMNDNNGSLFLPTTSWMSQLHPKYLPSWRIFLSPFDHPVSPRTTSEDNVNSAISYGVNANIYPNNTAMSADRISKATVFILFAPAQASGATVSFQGAAGTAAPGVTVNTSGTPAKSNPGGTAIGGTHSNRTKINALFADWHVEIMPWSSGTGAAFTNNAQTGNDPDGYFRWTPYTPYP